MKALRNTNARSLVSACHHACICQGLGLHGVGHGTALAGRRVLLWRAIVMMTAIEHLAISRW